jgi:hypothetical protein
MDHLPAPREKAEVVLRPAEGTTPNPPDLLHEIADLVHRLFPDVQEAAGWMLIGKKRKDEAEIAKIKADVIEKLGKLDLERQRLVDERDAALRKADQTAKELEIKRMEAKAAATGKLLAAYANALEKGVVFDARVMEMVGRELVKAMSFKA